MADIFTSSAQVLVNPVNLDGVMGKGLAKEFKKRWPDMFEDYQEACQEGALKLGRVRVWDNGIPNTAADIPTIYIANFPTKVHWRNPSRLIFIDLGLVALRQWLLNNPHITSIAVPALGCGLGGLDWHDVEPLIKRYLADLGVRVEIYPPEGDMYEL